MAADLACPGVQQSDELGLSIADVPEDELPGHLEAPVRITATVIQV